MKFLFSFILILTAINISLSVRHHNSNEEFTKITKKILPNSELCNEQNCPANRGTCSGENFCFCFDGYFSTYESNVLCDYEQKDRTLYFLLEFVLSFGIGHFYVGKYIYGCIKLICFVLFFVVLVVVSFEVAVAVASFEVASLLDKDFHHRIYSTHTYTHIHTSNIHILII